MSALDELPRIGAPATRALEVAGVTTLRQLSGASKAELAAMHGVGPKAMGVIEEALGAHGLSLKP